MNSQLLKKIISSSETCPDFVFENPLLDRNVAKALVRSFVKILNLTQQNTNATNLRYTVLENIRNLCQSEPANHIKIDENLTQVLTDFYNDSVLPNKVTTEETIEKDLDLYLIKSFSQLNINSAHKPKLNAEVAQALINLNESGSIWEKILEDANYWDSNDIKYKTILVQIWSNDVIFDNLLQKNLLDGFCMKIKADIERMLLQICKHVLINRNQDIETYFRNNKDFMKLVKLSASSSNTFQMCANILNYLLIESNFDEQIQNVVNTFLIFIKSFSKHESISILYPNHLSHLVLILDVDINKFPKTLCNKYIKTVKEELQILELNYQNDFIMLLSHFPQWFIIITK